MFRGSLYGKWQAIVTFQQMIILADQDGTVDFTPEALSATTSIPLDILKEGLTLLEAPDQSSRTPDEEGRRIVRIDPERPWGWHIVNYQKYRSIRTAEDRREYHRQYWHKRKDNQSQPSSTDTQQNQPIVEAEVKVEVEAVKQKPASQKRKPHACGYLGCKAVGTTTSKRNPKAGDWFCSTHADAA